MLKIRLQRIGRKNNPSYRIIVIDSTVAAKKGKPVELLGTHDAIRKTTTLQKDRILFWIGKGAQVSDTMHNILIQNNVIEGKKKNALPKKTPIVKEVKEESKPEKSDDVTEEQTKDADSATEVEVTAQEKPENIQTDSEVKEESTTVKQEIPSKEG